MPSYVIPGVVIASLATGAYAAYHAVNNKYSAETADYLKKVAEERSSVAEMSHGKKSTANSHSPKQSEMDIFKFLLGTMGGLYEPAEEDEVDLNFNHRTMWADSQQRIALLKRRQIGCSLPPKLSAYFDCYNNSGGGDCLFYVLLLILQIEHEAKFGAISVHDLRTQIVDVLCNNSGNADITAMQVAAVTNYNFFYKRKKDPNINIRDYCKYMRRPGIWGTASEIAVFVHHYRVPVRVWRNDIGRNRIHELALFRRAIPVAEGQFPHCIYNTGNHYVYMAPKMFA